MRPRTPSRPPTVEAVRARVLFAAAALVVLLTGCGGGSSETGTSTDEAPPVETSTPTETAPPPVPPIGVDVSWDAAGAFVWHETDISPEALGEELRRAGFGWVALFVHDGLGEDPVEDDWVRRFRDASGLPVGGWGALRTQPVEEAALADSLLARYGLDFYVANAEAEFDAGGPDGQSGERAARSRAFVQAFRSLRPGLSAALSSYCRADLHDLDWTAWADAGFAFLPQAYVNDFGSEATPEVCVRSSRGWFPAGAVHPTIGMYPGVLASLRARRYARLLDEAGSVGFSVYLAETRMTATEWSALGSAITQLGIASPPGRS